MTPRFRSLAIVLIALAVLESGVVLGTTETFTYDDLGRLVIVDHGDGRATTYALDPAGNRKNVLTSDGTPPTDPTNLAASATSATQIDLSWTASTDNVGVTEYRVERCTGESCESFLQIAVPTSTTHSDATVSQTTTYRYRVRAGDGGGNLSGFSQPDDATTPDGTAPTVPQNLDAVAASATQVNLTWSESSDNVGVTGYRLDRCTGASCSDFTQIAAPSGTSHSDSPLSQLTTYRYRVRAIDAANNLSGYSGIDDASTPDGTPPDAPANLQATATSPTQIDLSWSVPYDNVGVTGYFVERCAGAGCGNFSEVATPSSNSHSDTTVGPATTYNYRVRAQDAAQNIGSYSSSASATTGPAVPGAPTVSSNKTILTQGGSYTISWTSVSGATSYELHQALNGGGFSVVYSGSNLSKLFTSASVGEWHYKAKACNASGCSGFSNLKIVTVCPSGGCF